MKTCYECLKKHARRIINFKKKEMKLLTNELQESYYKAKICYVCGKKLEDKYANDKKHCKGRDHSYQTGEHRGATHNICNLKDSIPKEIILHFHNESNYRYHFVKQKLKGLNDNLLV